jgi:hypothetical protein
MVKCGVLFEVRTNHYTTEATVKCYIRNFINVCRHIQILVKIG